MGVGRVYNLQPYNHNTNNVADKMLAFKNKTDANSPQEVSNNVRFIIMDYLREQMKQGIVVDREVEGRIVVEN